MPIIVKIGYFFSIICLVFSFKALTSPATLKKAIIYLLLGLIVVISVSVYHTNNPLLLLLVMLGGVTTGLCFSIRQPILETFSKIINTNTILSISATLVLYKPIANMGKNTDISFMIGAGGLAIINGCIAGLLGIAFSYHILRTKFRLSGSLRYAAFMVSIVLLGGKLFLGADDVTIAYLMSHGTVLTSIIFALSEPNHSKLQLFFSVGLGLVLPLIGILLNNYFIIILGGITSAAYVAYYSSFLALVKQRASLTELADHKLRITDVQEVAHLLKQVRKVVIVPGYGAVADQVQAELAALTKMLARHQIQALWAIHPAGGRSPGQLSVLLAQANISYNEIIEPAMVNYHLKEADLVLVIGANDIVNPVNTQLGTAPFELQAAKVVIFFKKSLATGYLAIQNPGFYYPNALLLFGNISKSIFQLTQLL